MNKVIPILAIVALLGFVPTSAAHAHATVIDLGDGARCYILTDGTDANIEFWYETNGFLTGGEARGPPGPESGLPVYGLPFWDLGEILFNTIGLEPSDLLGDDWEDGGSGLQRGPGGDTQIDQDTFQALCQA